MLLNVQPNRKRSKAGSLTAEEKKYVKTLFGKNYVVQDIAFIINQGRHKTVNQSVIQLCASDKSIDVVSDKKLEQYIKVQSSYDPVTLLNPYKDARLIRAREAMITAVQSFNNPSITFKTELFCVLANIAWTYLLHEKLEQTKQGSSLKDNGNSITVSGTLDKEICPIKDEAVKENLRKIIKIRDAVEHTFFVGGEECFGLLFQACCINFENHMTEWFGNHLSLSKELSLALQFVRLSKGQVTQVETTNFPKKIKALSNEILNSEFADNNAFQLTVFYSTEATSKTNADIHKLVNYKEDVEYQETAIKKQKHIKLSQDELVNKVREKGYVRFSAWEHQQFWKKKWPDAATRNKKAQDYGEVILKNQWLWYEQTWLPEVIKYCQENKDKFR